MAKSATTWEGRRALTDNPATSSGAYKSAAEEILKLDQLSEAAVFFGRAGDDESLRAIVDRAVAEGNFFVFKESFTRLKDKSSVSARDRLKDLKAAAESHGRLKYAEQAAAWLEDK